MKKALIDVKRINNSDVIATSGCSVSDFSKYSVLFQSNGANDEGAKENKGPRKGVNGGIYYNYNTYTGLFESQSGASIAVYNFTGNSYDCDSLESGKWYHVKDGFPASVIECTDPNHHGVSSN